jgi:hypothetical protein
MAFACGLASAAHLQAARVQALGAQVQATIGHGVAWHGIDGAWPASRTASRAGGVMTLKTGR